MENGIQWWWGDWLVYGEGNYPEDYSQGLSETLGITQESVRRLKWIAKVFPPYRRRYGVSWAHYAEVAAKEFTNDEQDEMLEGAEETGESQDDTRTRAKRKRKEKRLADLPDPPEYVGEFELDSIQVSDIELLDLPRASVDMIFTDPPYHEEYIDLYGKLAELAAHVLKTGAYLMTYCGKMYLPTIINTIEANGLEYIWTDAVFQPFSKSRISKHNIFENWRPIVVFKKPGDSKVREWVQDVVRGTREKDFHDWQQDEDAPRQYIPAYTFEGGIVLDPFVGGGTTPYVCKELGRHFLAFDKDVEAVKMSIARLSGHK
ncbi:MAG: site-specific DNA-methyltransferase [Blastocatellia bacterium]|nr:site-specific DNA-methyltransferase [Blastocatellia bacterium]